MTIKFPVYPTVALSSLPQKCSSKHTINSCLLKSGNKNPTLRNSLLEEKIQPGHLINVVLFTTVLLKFFKCI